MRHRVISAPNIAAVIVLLNPAIVSAEVLPITIEVTQDVRGVDGNFSYQKRGTLYSNRPFQIDKGERFQVIELAGEGGCRILHQGKEYDLSSCPWRPGFTDHQSDIFSIVTVDVNPELTTKE